MQTIHQYKTKLQTFLVSVDSVLTLIFGEVDTSRVKNEFPINTERRALETASINFNLKKRGVK